MYVQTSRQDTMIGDRAASAKRFPAVRFTATQRCFNEPAQSLTEDGDVGNVESQNLRFPGWGMKLENDLRSARAAILGSLGFLAIAMGILVVSGQPVRSFSSVSTPEIAESSASPVASPVSESAVAEVAIRKLTFRPFRVTIPIGGRVAWTNFDGVPHTVTARDSFDSGRIDLNGSYIKTFTVPGEYWYECLYHKDMVAVVEVVDPSP